MIEIFNMNLSENESREVAFSGEYFELRNAMYDINMIELIDRSGGMISRLKNPEQSDFVRPGKFETIRITNGPTAQQVKCFVGSGDAGSRRTSGNVSVIDGGKNRVMAGGAFTAHMWAPAVAGQMSGCQIWNPANSGKAVIIEQINPSIATGYALLVAITNVTVNAASPATIGNKKSGQPAGSALAYYSSNIVYVSAGFAIPQPMALKNPFVIMPGYGLMVYAASSNIAVGADIEFFEESF